MSSGRFAVTWWGHSFTTVELDGLRLATDPLLTRRLAHLRRDTPAPPRRAADADVVLLSHLHQDHLHVPSLRQLRAGTLVVAPAGSRRLLRSLTGLHVIEVAPGDLLDVAGVRVQVTTAKHDDRRAPVGGHHSRAVGFRVTGTVHTLWYPGDTGLTDQMAALDPVDLALVPIGGWGPSLGEQHLNPVQAAEAVRRVGARHVLPVHYGTFWPIGLRHARPGAYRHFFTEPAAAFEAAMADQLAATTHLAVHGVRIDLTGQP